VAARLQHWLSGQGRPIAVANPRWRRCACQTTGPQTFRPTTQWLTGHTSPELLYLETQWASLISYAKVVDLLKDVLLVTETMNQETVRQHSRLLDALLTEPTECCW
jgi:hypothetical protein